jgi:hypothetical protein
MVPASAAATNLAAANKEGIFAGPAERAGARSVKPEEGISFREANLR